MRRGFVLLTVAAAGLVLWAEFGGDRADTARARVAAALPTLDTVARAAAAEWSPLEIDGRPAFVYLPRGLPHGEKPPRPIPWVWYAPTVRGSPKPVHAWMFRRLLDAGFAIAGVGIGESMGNPKGRAIYSAFHERATEAFGLAKRACLMPQSRGGLMLYNWAAEHPEAVACIAGIYTVCDIRRWPGLERAAPAYGLTEPQLAAVVEQHNPIDRLLPLAEAGVPILHIHGDNDRSVPIEQHAGALAKRYQELGGEVELLVVAGGGHDDAKEIFERQEVVDFVLEHGVPGVAKR